MGDLETPLLMLHVRPHCLKRIQPGPTIPKSLNTFQMYAAALANPESAQAASQAFRDICEACGSRLSPHLDALMQLYQSVQSAGAMSDAASKSSLDEEGVLQVPTFPGFLQSFLASFEFSTSLGIATQCLTLQRQQQIGPGLQDIPHGIRFWILLHSSEHL